MFSWGRFFIALIINFALSFLISSIFGNYYLASIISSLTCSLVFAFVYYGFKGITTYYFWYQFALWGIIFLILDAFEFLIIGF